MGFSFQPWAMGRTMPVPGAINVGKTFAEAAESYIASGGEAKFLPRIVEHFRDRQLASIFPFDLQDMANKLYPTQSAATKNRQALAPARAVINHAYDRGWCCLIRLKRFKEETPQRRPAATAEWMILFLRQCKQDRLHRLAALVLFMNRTGARISEALNLMWDDVDLVNRRALLRKTKTEKNSMRYLTDDLISHLYALGPKPGERVFGYRNRHSINERLVAVCGRAKIRYLPTHSVGRRAFAKNTVALGIDTKTAMTAGGWKSSRIFLEVYVQSDDGGRIVAERFNSHRYDTEA